MKGRTARAADAVMLQAYTSRYLTRIIQLLRHVAAVQDQRLSAPSGCSARSTYQLLCWLVQCFMYMHYYSDMVTN